jgi:enediyne biosynthesis protein E7
MTIAATAAKRRAPGPRGTWWWGSLGEFRRDPLELLSRAAAYGDLVRLRFGPVVAHLANHPDLIRHVLVDAPDNYDKNTRSVAKMRATCGTSLLTADGDVWLRLRRIAQPAFQASELSRFTPAIVETVRDWLDGWEVAAREQKPLDLVAEMMHLTVTIAARMFFGIDVKQEAIDIEQALGAILDDTWRRLESLIDPSAVAPVLHRPRFRAAKRRLESIVSRAADQRRDSSGASRDLLSALLAARDDKTRSALSHHELRSAVITLLLAGHETTANALAWTFYLLMQHPTVCATLQSEIDLVLAGQAPDAANWRSLEYVSRVFAESIRLYPSIWIMERRVVTDDWLAGFRVCAGSTLLISPYVLHRSEQFWPEPERFDPDRFTSTACAERPRLADLPFGAGPHVCIGREMAELVAVIVIAMIAQRFRLGRIDAEPAVPLAGITLRHGQPLWVRLTSTAS